MRSGCPTHIPNCGSDLARELAGFSQMFWWAAFWRAILGPQICEGGYSMPKLENRFPTTRWSLVARAQDADPELRRQAMGQLLREYWRPLRGYLVAWGIREDRADDLVQGFIASRVIEQQLIDGAEAERGRFRTYLLTALRRYAANVIRDEQAAKRGGGVVLSLSQLGEPADCSTDPADAMDAAWARHVLRRAIDRMRFE